MMTVEVVLEHRVNAERVEVAGCFTDWSPVLMSRDDGDLWSYTASLVPGRAVTFKFVVDGTWVASDSYSHVDDGHCGVNNTLYVSRPPPTTPKSGTDSVLSMDSAVNAEPPCPSPPTPELPPEAEPLTDELENAEAELEAEAGADDESEQTDDDDEYADASDAEKKPAPEPEPEPEPEPLVSGHNTTAQTQLDVEGDMKSKLDFDVKPDTLVEDGSVDSEFVEEKTGGCVVV